MKSLYFSISFSIIAIFFTSFDFPITNLKPRPVACSSLNLKEKGQLLKFCWIKRTPIEKKKWIIPQKAIWVRRKPGATKGGPAFTRFESGLHADESEKLGAISQALVTVIAELPGIGRRVKGTESVLGFTASEDGQGLVAADGGEGEEGAGETDEEAEEWKDENGPRNSSWGKGGKGLWWLDGFGGVEGRERSGSRGTAGGGGAVREEGHFSERRGIGVRKYSKLVMKKKI